MTQRLKFGFFLTTLVTIPILIMGIVGLSAIKTELTNYQLREKQNATIELDRLDHTILVMFSDLKRSIRKGVNRFHNRAIWALSCSQSNKCPQYHDQRIDLIISYNAKGNQIYPPKQTTGQPSPEQQAIIKISSSLTTARDHLRQIPLLARMNGVWSTYLTPEGHHLIYCWLGTNNLNFCAVINRPWLINHVSKTLKQQLPTSETRHIRLMDVHNNIIWQNKNPISRTEITRKQLSSPLYFWRLEVIETAPYNKSGFSITVTAIILSLAAFLITIAFLLFRTQKQALAQADKRTEFAATISHELRTPLTNLQLYADLIMAKAKKTDQTNEDYSKDREDITKYTNVIAQETTRLSEMVNNALTIAKDRNINKPIKNVAIPDHIITETISRLTPLLGDTKNNITYDLNTANEVMIDRSALEQILVNLIDNARKYANGQRIRISTILDKNMLTLTVRDWGPDFKPHKLSNLFTPFFRRVNENKNQITQDGFGLGLTVCKQLAEANNGTITCEPAKPGAKFIVTMEVNEA